MAKHKVTRFADSQVYNKPHLILPDNLQQICSYLETRNGMSVWKDELIDAAVKSNALAEEYKESLGYGESESGCSHLYSVENGIAYLIGFEAGTYALVETKAPNGYIIPDGQMQLDVVETIGVDKDGKEFDRKKFKDTKDPKLSVAKIDKSIKLLE